MMAAHTAMHTRNDSGVSVHSFIRHENPPSPTLTNPDMIVPIPPWEHGPLFDGDNQAPHPLLEPEIPLTQSVSNSSLSRDSAASAKEVAVTAAVLMPPRLSATPLPSIRTPAASLPSYTGYEHGAPLSDIYEESEATPRSTALRSRTPSPDSGSEQPSTPTRPQLRHKKRLSEISSSSGDSDVGDWEHFDSSKVLSSRVAADLAQMKREDTLEVEELASRRQSREEEELAALNARAERILANARKRLTHMEDNLKTARTSVLVPRSPLIGDSHQPVGALYRSISAAGVTKAKQRQAYPSIRTSSSLQHMRGNSETGVPSSNKHLSRLPDVRSASALEYGSSARYSLFPDTNQSPTSRYQPSPVSNRSFNSPLHPLEEERDSPSTAETTPESVKIPPVRGLGILTSAAISRENLVVHPERSSSRQTPTPTAALRPSSAASTRSAKELKEQMSDLKTKLADLRSKAQADNLRRRSMQSSRSFSPFMNTSAQPEQWYASSPAHDNDSLVNQHAGIEWRGSESPLPGYLQAENVADRNDDPVTPANAKFLDVDHMTPGAEAQMLSSARTDRNTPSLARKHDVQAGEQGEDADDDAASVVHASQYDDPHNDLVHLEDEDDENDRIAENEEEQIYLNEVLEESLREAEVEPEVPMIPGNFLPSPDGVPVGQEPQRHEDRLDAFDYENMFLHSAMGTYTGKSLNGSDSGSDTESDDDGSVETSRAGGRTSADESEPDTEPPTDEEMEQIVDEGKSSGFGLQRTPQSEDRAYSEKQFDSLPPADPPLSPVPKIHSRSKSMESVSTAATFETATEGGHYDDMPTEILNWDPMPSSSLGYSPTSYQPYRTSSAYSPVRHRHGFSSPQGGGRSTLLNMNPPSNSGSPLRQQLAPAAADAMSYINDNGVPERFQGQPPPHHSISTPSHRRDGSAATLQPTRRASSQATIKTAPAAHNSTPLTPNDRMSNEVVDDHSPVVAGATTYPQKKTVLNRPHPLETYNLEPQYAPPSAPLPAPPTLSSSTALQAQMTSPPKKSALKQSPGRSNSVLRRNTPTPSSQRAPSFRDSTASPAAPAPAPNTEILMESLIKLANPGFSLAPGIRFSEVDKSLVLELLGAVGGVCDEILTAGTRGWEAEDVVGRMRHRLQGARDILQGFKEGKTVEQRTMREI